MILYSLVGRPYNTSITEGNTEAQQGVMRLTTRERILMIRLVEKLKRNPTFAKALGVEATGAVKNQKIEADPKGLAVA